MSESAAASRTRRRRRGPRVSDDAIRSYAQNLLRWQGFVLQRGRRAKGSSKKPLMPALIAHFRLSRRRLEKALAPLRKPQRPAVPTAPSSAMALAHQAAARPGPEIASQLRQAAVAYLQRGQQRDPDVIEACKLIIEAIRA